MSIDSMHQAAGSARARLLVLLTAPSRLPPTLRGMLWTALSGIIFSSLNAVMRVMTLELGPFQTQFLRYLFGLGVMLPFVLWYGIHRYRPHVLGGQVWRGLIHTAGLLLWFVALPRIPLADMTAIGFTGPIFIMIGAVLLFGERMIWARWAASAVGFLGVLIVVAPKLSGAGGYYSLVMLASSPLFAASFLITKSLVRYDRPEVIVVWQSLAITVFTLPLALLDWVHPSPSQWALFIGCGMLGSAGHYCMTRGIRIAEISATQSISFLNLIWASILGYAVFSDVPTHSTMLGGLVIFAATTWIARREARAAKAPPAASSTPAAAPASLPATN